MADRDDLAFTIAEVVKSGTSEGARKAAETRKMHGGGAEPLSEIDDRKHQGESGGTVANRFKKKMAESGGHGGGKFVLPEHRAWPVHPDVVAAAKAIKPKHIQQTLEALKNNPPRQESPAENNYMHHSREIMEEHLRNGHLIDFANVHNYNRQEHNEAAFKQYPPEMQNLIKQERKH